MTRRKTTDVSESNVHGNNISTLTSYHSPEILSQLTSTHYLDGIAHMGTQNVYLS